MPVRAREPRLVRIRAAKPRAAPKASVAPGGIKRATCSPRRVMTISSPPMARSTSSENGFWLRRWRQRPWWKSFENDFGDSAKASCLVCTDAHPMRLMFRFYPDIRTHGDGATARLDPLNIFARHRDLRPAPSIQLVFHAAFLGICVRFGMLRLVAN